MAAEEGTMLAQIAAMTITVLTQSGEPDVLHGRVMAHVDRLQARSGLGDQPPPPMEVAFVELNGEEPPEALLFLEGLWCGARGCHAIILDLSGTEAREIGRFIAVAIPEPLATETNGWRDVAISGNPMVFRDGEYGPPASR